MRLLAQTVHNLNSCCPLAQLECTLVAFFSPAAFADRWTTVYRQSCTDGGAGSTRRFGMPSFSHLNPAFKKKGFVPRLIAPLASGRARPSKCLVERMYTRQLAVSKPQVQSDNCCAHHGVLAGSASCDKSIVTLPRMSAYKAPARFVFFKPL